MMYGTIIEHINSGGLELLYKAMLESSKEEFCAALDTVLEVRLRHHPICLIDVPCHGAALSSAGVSGIPARMTSTLVLCASARG